MADLWDSWSIMIVEVHYFSQTRKQNLFGWAVWYTKVWHLFIGLVLLLYWLPEYCNQNCFGSSAGTKVCLLPGFSGVLFKTKVKFAASSLKGFYQTNTMVGNVITK